MQRKPPDLRVIRCDHTEGIYHDCAYVDAVNRLTGNALREADRQIHDDLGAGVLTFGDADAIRAARDRYFHAEMQSLCEDAGLRRPKPRRVVRLDELKRYS